MTLVIMRVMMIFRQSVLIKKEPRIMMNGGRDTKKAVGIVKVIR